MKFSDFVPYLARCLNDVKLFSLHAARYVNHVFKHSYILELANSRFLNMRRFSNLYSFRVYFGGAVRDFAYWTAERRTRCFKFAMPIGVKTGAKQKQKKTQKSAIAQVRKVCVSSGPGAATWNYICALFHQRERWFASLLHE